MLDRGAFWSAVPDWSSIFIQGAGWRAAPSVARNALHLVSGDLSAFARRYGAGPILGPRESCDREAYRLRLAPDRLLQVGGIDAAPQLGWSAEGFAVSEISDGMILFDLIGAAVASILALASCYDFGSTTISPMESAMMPFAGQRVAVSKRKDGWRLHVERASASALWRWLEMAAADLDKGARS